MYVTVVGHLNIVNQPKIINVDRKFWVINRSDLLRNFVGKQRTRDGGKTRLLGAIYGDAFRQLGLPSSRLPVDKQTDYAPPYERQRANEGRERIEVRVLPGVNQGENSHHREGRKQDAIDVAEHRSPSGQLSGPLAFRLEWISYHN